MCVCVTQKSNTRRRSMSHQQADVQERPCSLGGDTRWPRSVRISAADHRSCVCISDGVKPSSKSLHILLCESGSS